MLRHFEKVNDGRGYSNRIASTGATIRFEGDSQILVSGWVSPREQGYFNFRQVKRSDLKIKFQRSENGDLEIINGLGVDIIRFRFLDRDGVSFSVKNVKAGETAVLEEKNQEPFHSDNKDFPKVLRTVRPSASRHVFENMFDDQNIGLGHYMAETSQSAFVDPIQKKHDRKTCDKLYLRYSGGG